MLEAFIEQNYLIIENNVVTNICLWDGDTSKWTPPQGAIAIPFATTPALLWGLNEDKTDYILVEALGEAGIGFTWDGTACTTNLPKPEIPATLPA